MRKKIFYSLFIIFYLLIIAISFIGSSKGVVTEGSFAIDELSYGNHDFVLSQRNMMVSIDLEVIFGELSVYIMNDTEFVKWLNFQPSIAVLVYNNVENLSISLQFLIKGNLNLVLVNNHVSYPAVFHLKLVVDHAPLIDSSIRDFLFQIWVILFPVSLLTTFIIQVKRSKRQLELNTIISIRIIFRKSILDILGIFGIKTRKSFLIWLLIGYISVLCLILSPIKYFNELYQNIIMSFIAAGIILILYPLLIIVILFFYPYMVYEFIAGTSYYYNSVFNILGIFSPILLTSFIMHILEYKLPNHPIFQREIKTKVKSGFTFGSYSFKATRKQKHIWSKINLTNVDKSLNSAIINQLMSIIPGTSIKLEEMTNAVEDLVVELNLTTEKIQFRIKTFINTFNYFKFDYESNSIIRNELTGETAFNHVKWIENEDNTSSYFIDPYILNKRNFMIFKIVGLVISLLYLSLGLFFTDMSFSSTNNIWLSIIISFTFLVFLFITVFFSYKEGALAFTDKYKVKSVYKIIVMVFFIITLILINLDFIYNFVDTEKSTDFNKIIIFSVIYFVEVGLCKVIIPIVYSYISLKMGYQHFSINYDNKFLLIDRKAFLFKKHKETIQTVEIMRFIVIDEEMKDYTYHKAKNKENKMSRKQKRAHRFHLYAIMEDQSQKLILTTRIYRILLNIKNKIEETISNEIIEN